LESLRSVYWMLVDVCLFVGMPGCLRVLNGSGGYRWHSIKESAGHLAIECSFKDPIVVMGRGNVCVRRLRIESYLCLTRSWPKWHQVLMRLRTFRLCLSSLLSSISGFYLFLLPTHRHGVRLGNDCNGQRFILFTLH